jgi:hypothetical protein
MSVQDVQGSFAFQVVLESHKSLVLQVAFGVKFVHGSEVHWCQVLSVCFTVAERPLDGLPNMWCAVGA